MHNLINNEKNLICMLILTIKLTFEHILKVSNNKIP